MGQVFKKILKRGLVFHFSHTLGKVAGGIKLDAPQFEGGVGEVTKSAHLWLDNEEEKNISWNQCYTKAKYGQKYGPASGHHLISGDLWPFSLCSITIYPCALAVAWVNRCTFYPRTLREERGSSDGHFLLLLLFFFFHTSRALFLLGTERLCQVQKTPWGGAWVFGSVCHLVLLLLHTSNFLFLLGTENTVGGDMWVHR